MRGKDKDGQYETEGGERGQGGPADGGRHGDVIPGGDGGVGVEKVVPLHTNTQLHQAEEEEDELDPLEGIVGHNYLRQVKEQ